jgi:hypothetical protein
MTPSGGRAQLDMSVQARRKYSGPAPRQRGSRARAAAKVQSNIADVTRFFLRSRLTDTRTLGVGESDQRAGEVTDPARRHEPGEKDGHEAVTREWLPSRSGSR